jgi:hypothetical protein
VKRFAVVVATAGLLATSLGLSGPSALAAGALNLSIDSAGTKKVDVSWDDASSIVTPAFDAYLVTLDNDSTSTPGTADRSRFVQAAGTRVVQFEDLNSNTTYYASVYAVDFNDTGFTIVPADGADPDTALDTAGGRYTPLTIKSNTTTVLSGKTVTLSGTLRDDVGDPIANANVTMLYDVYPQFGGSTPKVVKTDASGRWSVTSPTLTANTWFWAEYQATGDVGGWTGRILVEVRKKISVTVTPGLTVNAGDTVKFDGKVQGNPDFLDDAPVKVCLQRLEGGNWKKLLCRSLAANGGYTLSFKPGANADGKYRVFSGMGPAYADSWSRTKKLVVK